MIVAAARPLDQASARTAVASRETVRVITWSARIVGLIAVASVVWPAGRVRLRGTVERWLDLPPQATLAAAALVLASGVLLLMVATGLRRRKRRAWQLALLMCASIALPHLVLWRGVGSALTALALGVALLRTRSEFTAQPDPVGKGRGVLVFCQLVGAGFVINMLLLTLPPKHMVMADGWWQRVEHAALSFAGISGDVRFGSEWMGDLVALVGGVFGMGALLLGGYFLLRTAEPKPGLSTDEADRLRELIDRHGTGDSLAYFALRSDKSVVLSPTGKAAVSYRVLAGVALASGDPLGDKEAWPGAIEAFRAECRGHGWVPAVLGCSELGATVWCRHGLDALELGDEAVVDVATFTLDGRCMRGVRQAVAKLRRAGYTVSVRRVAELAEPERQSLAELAERWRGTETERGFSMALSRPAARVDPACVVVTAEKDDQVSGMLQFVPWGRDGLSLDLMRRDRLAGDNGLNELMITSLLAQCPALGVSRVSLNFAVFRAALERGRRIGAGPVARLWARALRLGSRWWQIESLYRFNAKFDPAWVPRYLLFPAVRDLPRIALAAIEAEGFGGRPPALLRVLRR
ncbi:phosphatidylglycerol lysyltransferase domain-containing protein [Labedaea rhizosphaerae]|uniref:Lysyl-tRNA synthetase class 2 n=1 Tax=Labedaea rhizosphaerae TaxID=598644 RepID=A0A4R6SMZ9_LABRH|nr:phosphatidylglycerol lysyltransferase domain-containing protein [Labedaea rhizosphaerae]TDQ04940.1 lysyl-tRNA synthetase class 2 [Labedaea rhizosphaerae]